jgi:hypothetical protein
MFDDWRDIDETALGEKKKLCGLTEGEIEIMAADGSRKPMAKTIGWCDRLILPREQSLFSRLGW